MKNILISLFSIGWINILSPSGISVMVMLLHDVKKKWHSLLFAIASYLAYALGGIAIFYGVDVFLKEFYLSIKRKYPAEIAWAKLLLGVLSIAGFIAMVIYLYRAAKCHRELKMSDMLRLKSVSPVFIVLLAFGSTWSQIFTCVPLLTFIGVLVANHAALTSAAVWIFIYALFSLIPTAGVYILSCCVRGERFQKIIRVTGKIMTYFCFYCIPVLLAVGAWWGIREAVLFFIG